MPTHTFTAATMAEAMEQVRFALGPDAVIVTTRAGQAGGVEVVAAEAAAEQDAGSEDGGREDAAAGRAAGPVLDFRLARRQRDGHADEASADRAAITVALAYHGVPAPLAGELARLAEAADADDPAQALAAALSSRLRFSARLPAPGAPLVLVGPPGAGKTVTAAKLASLCALADAPVALLTTDTARAGGRAQLDHFAGLLGCPLIAIPAPETLAARLDEQADRACIVDTMGANPFDPADLAGLGRLLRGVGRDVALVMPAGGDAGEAAEIGAAFAAAGARRLIATRLDATRRLGGVLAAADAGLALGHAGITPYIARGLGRLDPLSLARLLLDDPAARPPSPSLQDFAE